MPALDTRKLTIFTLRPGPSKARPITMSLRTPPDEDGVRGGLEADLTVDEARGMVRDLTQVCAWVEAGVWRSLEETRASGGREAT